MGKRYGRNQKRRHREEIKKLSSELVSCRKTGAIATNLLSESRAKINRQQKQLEDIISSIKRVARFSSCVPPETRQVNGRYDQYRVESRQPFSMDDLDIGSISFEVIDLYRLECFVRDHWKKFSKSAHLRLSNGKESVYMISEEALRNISTRELIERLLPDLAEQLISHLKRH